MLAVIAIAALAMHAVNSWPVMPLDLPARDPQVQAAFDRAVRSHVVRYLALTAVPLFIAAVAIWRRRDR